MNEDFSGIDVQLKCAAELIPNLVETVKGYAAHEKSTLDAVIAARTAAANAQGPPPSALRKVLSRVRSAAFAGGSLSGPESQLQLPAAADRVVPIEDRSPPPAASTIRL